VRWALSQQPHSWQINRETSLADRNHAEPPTEEVVEQKHLSRNAALPDIATMKDFLECYATSNIGLGQLAKNIKVRSLVTTAKNLRARLADRTGNLVAEEQKHEIRHVRSTRRTITRLTAAVDPK
jgi:hypothetical protein